MTEVRSSPRAIVTGASGFIGSHLIEHLRRAGWRVAVISRENSAQRLEAHPAISAVYSYSGKTSEVNDALADFRPDVVFHLSSLFLAQHDSSKVEPLVSSNILFGTQLLDAMRLAGVTALVNTGTAWQNFAGDSYDPVNLYAATKQAFEDIVLYYARTCGLRAITLRLFDSYGPGDSRPKLLALLLNAIKTGKELGMSPGEQILDLVYIDDICRAFLQTADLLRSQLSPSAAVYAVSSGERRTLREVVETLGQVTGRNVPVRFNVRPYREREVMIPWSGLQLPGWRAEVSLAEGFRRLFDADPSITTQ